MTEQNAAKFLKEKQIVNVFSFSMSWYLVSKVNIKMLIFGKFKRCTTVFVSFFVAKHCAQFNVIHSFSSQFGCNCISVFCQNHVWSAIIKKIYLLTLCVCACVCMQCAHCTYSIFKRALPLLLCIYFMMLN